MLVLTRRAGESIMIADDVRVVVLEVRGDTVRLGIEAPRHVQVHRAEVYAEVQAANAAAAVPSQDLAAAAAQLSKFARGGAPRPRQSVENGGRAAVAKAPASQAAASGVAPDPKPDVVTSSETEPAAAGARPVPKPGPARPKA